MQDTDVLIIGGGASGLTSSILLSKLGVRTILVSKYAEPSTSPKAHLLSIKTMEMYRELGIEQSIRDNGTPAQNMRYVGWYAGLAGPTTDHGRELARLGAWGRGHEETDWRRASATPYANLMQSKLEPILKAKAESLAPECVSFNHSFISMEQNASGVVATVEDRESGETYQVRARYMLACDGGRIVGSQIGVEMQGHLAVATNVSVHFSANLSEWARDPEVLIRTILNPDVGTPCVLVPVGPDAWGPESREWVLHFISFPGDHKKFNQEETLKAMRLGLGLPDLAPQILAINQWPLDAVVASKFQVDRVFMMGDAAHRMPPSGGHGLNTAVQDSYNLCWKIAAVLHGQADERLLSSFEAERRPVAQRTVASAFGNWQNSRQFYNALGFLPGREANAIWQDFRTFWDGAGPDAEGARRRALQGFRFNLTTYNHLKISYGYTYQAGAIVLELEGAPPASESLQIYQPSTAAGCSVPDAMLEDLHGPTPLSDLLGSRFVLIAGEDGQAWCEAARKVASERGIPLEAITIGVADGDYLDMLQEWQRLREIGPGGALLVRPDRFIAWRAMVMANDPLAILDDVFNHLLGASALDTAESFRKQFDRVVS